MVATVTIICGVIAIITALAKGFSWAVKKIKLYYQECINDATIKKQIEAITNQLQANSEGTRALLRFRLRAEMVAAIKIGYTNITEFNDITKMYTAYRHLGGNGTIEHLYEEYCELPLLEK